MSPLVGDVTGVLATLSEDNLWFEDSLVRVDVLLGKLSTELESERYRTFLERLPSDPNGLSEFKEPRFCELDDLEEPNGLCELLEVVDPKGLIPPPEAAR